MVVERVIVHRKPLEVRICLVTSYGHWTQSPRLQAKGQNHKPRWIALPRLPHALAHIRATPPAAELLSAAVPGGGPQRYRVCNRAGAQSVKKAA
jgi:hypothetical protein